MSDPLASARLKLKRANLHAGTLKREAIRFLKAHPQPTFLGKFNTDFTRYVIHISTGYPDPPDLLSLLIGDAIHNYRSALDHVAWQLVLRGANPNPKRPIDVQFPIYSRRRDFNGNIHRRLPGADPDAVKFIKSRNAKPRWNSRNNVLLHLADMSNDDKHRNVHVAASAMHMLRLNPFPVDCVIVGTTQRRKPPRLYKGAKVTTLLTTPLGPRPKMYMQPEIFATVALDNGLIAGAVLDDFRKEVVTILDAPEIRAALA